MSDGMDSFTRDGLAARGFVGFVRFQGIDYDQIHDEPGVYVVLREKTTRPAFLDDNPAGHFKGRNPTVPVAQLEARWPDGAQCVYIGKAAAGARGTRHLRQRIKEFRKYGDGQPVGHQGGGRIWQIADADEFVLAWIVTGDEEPEKVEGELLRAFVAEHGKRPVGNRTSGRRR
jgi:hypothetical protein